MANTNVKRVKVSDLELKDRLVAIQRVTKVTKGGRHFSFAAIVVVGDENQNVLAKSKGSSNPHNLVKATVAALVEMRDAYTVAGLRGIPMSRVFNG